MTEYEQDAFGRSEDWNVSYFSITCACVPVLLRSFEPSDLHSDNRQCSTPVSSFRVKALDAFGFHPRTNP